MPFHTVKTCSGNRWGTSTQRIHES